MLLVDDSMGSGNSYIQYIDFYGQWYFWVNGGNNHTFKDVSKDVLALPSRGNELL